MSRPGGPPQGSRRIQVITNSFKITGLPQKPYYQYDAFDDEKLSRKGNEPQRRRIDAFERLQNHAQPAIFKPKVIYDSDAIAYSSTVLSFGNSATFEVNMTDRPPREGGQSRGIVKVTLKRVDAAPVTFEDLQSLLDGGTTQLTPRATVALNLIQLILRQAPNLKYPNNVKAFFCKEAGSRPLGGGLEIFKGYYQSVRPTLRALQVNIDTSCGVIYQEGRMLDVALSFLGARDLRDLNLPEGSPQLAKLKKFFKGIFITFTHRKGKKKIESIVPRAGLETFDWNKSEGIQQTVTVQTYFREAWNVTIRNPEAIGVKVGGGSIVPVELCIVTPNQRFTRRLPPELTKGMVEFTSDKPSARLDSIRRGLGGALDYASSPFVRDAQLVVAPTPTMIDGKVLSTPPIRYKGPSPVTPRAGSWNAVNQQFFQPKNIACWAVVDYSPNPHRNRQANERFVGMIQENCRKLGMSMAPLKVYISGSGTNVMHDLMQAAKQATAAQNITNAPPDLLLVILPQSAPEIRYQVKRFGDVLEGVVTQCVRVDKIFNCKDQYCNNLAMKMNAKLGGINAVPFANVLMNLSEKPFMIIGADVGHPAPGVSDQPSVASLVASYDMQAMKYNAYTTVQPPRLEPIDQLQSMMLRALEDFGKENRAAPLRIVFFRDGLSEGEYTKVAQKEIEDIKSAIDELWKNRNLPPPKPTLTFIVVGKRHHVRFFPNNQQDADRSGNCPAGFVADQGIGNPIAKDYYLLSHGGLLGTSRPSHYIIILDENFQNNINNLQELSFALCHSYARATRSVSIPAPVYYADLVCGRANFHFPPELKYDDSSASVASGGPSFNLQAWQAAFQGAHRNMTKKMFYM